MPRTNRGGSSLLSSRHGRLRRLLLLETPPCLPPLVRHLCRLPLLSSSAPSFASRNGALLHFRKTPPLQKCAPALNATLPLELFVVAPSMLLRRRGVNNTAFPDAVFGHVSSGTRSSLHLVERSHNARKNCNVSLPSPCSLCQHTLYLLRLTAKSLEYGGYSPNVWNVGGRKTIRSEHSVTLLLAQLLLRLPMA